MNPSPINLPSVLPPVHPTKKISQSPIALPRVSLSPSPITTMTPNNMKKNIPVLAPLAKKIDGVREEYVPPSSRSTVRPTTSKKGRPTTSKNGRKTGGRKMRKSRKRKSRKNKK